MKTGHSITTTTLLQMSLRITIVVTLAALFSYLHVIDTVEQQFIDNLRVYTEERAQHESTVFTLFHAKQEKVKEQLESRFVEIDEKQAQQWFEDHYTRRTDGTFRLNEREFDGYRDERGRTAEGITGKLDDKQPDSLDWRLMTVLYDILREFGPTLGPEMPNLYFSTPRQDFTIFWPGHPAARTISAEEDMSKLEWVAVASKEDNPQRAPVWTGLYFDPLVDSWMASLETPVDIDGEHIATIGMDILLDDLLSRTANMGFPGTYNVMVTAEGRLISHPGLNSRLSEFSDGILPMVGDWDDPMVKAIYDIAKTAAGPGVRVDKTLPGYYLAVTRITGPDWYFVTVFPEEHIESVALDIARFVLGLGLLSLVAEICLLYFVFRNQVTQPLAKLMAMVQTIRNGVFDSRVDLPRKNELGTLGDTLNEMCETIAKREAELRAINENLEQRVAERTSALEAINAELQKAKEKAEKADQTKSIFLATMSHDLRTPLNAILGFADVIRKQAVGADRPEKYAEYAQDIYDSGQILLYLINSLLDLSKIEAGEYLIKPAWTGYEELIDECHRLFDTQVKKKRITFVIEKPDSGLELLIDRVAFVQMTMNLISNAVKFTPENGHITVSCRSDGSGARLGVTDDGEGFDMVELDKVLSPFGQLENDPEVARHGTGLGLPIVKSLIALHEGRLEIDSRQGKGTEATLVFPPARVRMTSTET